MRDDPGLLLDRALPEARAPLGDDDRHGRAGSRGPLCAGRARTGEGPHRDSRRDPGRHGAQRANPPQVPDQEHDGLPAVRLPRRRYAARDLPPPRRRVRGDARLRRGGGLRHGAPPPAHHDHLGPLRRHPQDGRARSRPGGRGRDGGGDDGGAGPDRGELLDPGHARVLARAAARVRRPPGRVPLGRLGRARRDGGAGEGGAGGSRDAARPRVHPRRGADRDLLEDPRGVARHRGADAPAGHGAHRRGRLRPAGSDRRVRRGHPGHPGQARLPSRRGGAYIRGEPSLHAHAQLRRGGGPRSLRGIHERSR